MQLLVSFFGGPYHKHLMTLETEDFPGASLKEGGGNYLDMPPRDGAERSHYDMHSLMPLPAKHWLSAIYRAPEGMHQPV